MATYRVRVAGIEAAANGTVNADCFIELRGGTSPNWTWTLTQNGHRTIVLQATDVLAIMNDGALTNPQKSNAIEALIKTQALATGIDIADEAYADILARLPKILTPGDPEVIIIRQ